MDYEKICKYTIAGTCGVLGFIVTYISFGIFSNDVSNWLKEKIGGR